MDENTNKTAKAVLNQYADTMHKNLGIDLSEEERSAIIQMAESFPDHSSSATTQFSQKLINLGFTEEEILSVLDELAALTNIRLLMRIYDAIPTSKRNTIQSLAYEGLTPIQLQTLVETVFKKETGEDLVELTENLYSDTLDAYLKDINQGMDEINQALAEE